MKKRIITIMLVTCIIAGCGNAERSDVNNTSTEMTETTQKQQTEGEQQTEEEIQKEEIQKEEVLQMREEEETKKQQTPEEKIVQKELSEDVNVKEKCKQFEETDIKINNKVKKKKMDYSNVAEAKDISNDEISNITKMPYDAKNNYKNCKMPEQLEKNIKQKLFNAECKKVENIVSKEGMFQKSEATFEARYVTTVEYSGGVGLQEDFDEFLEAKENDTSIRKCYFGLHDKKNNKKYTCSVLSNVAWDTEDGTDHYCVNDKTVALFEDAGIKDRICVIDMAKKQYQIIDFGNMMRNEYGICGENSKYTEVMSSSIGYTIAEHEFIDKNTLALATYSNHLFVYDIKKECITECVDFNTDNIKDISIRIDGEIANVVRRYKNGTTDFYAIDLNNMNVVSYIYFENSAINSGYYRCMYKNGITYLAMADGLYTYNPDTKIFDALYAQLEDNTEYTYEKVAGLNQGKDETDGTYMFIETEIVFEGKEIYLSRYVWYDDSESTTEIIYKKLTMK